MALGIITIKGWYAIKLNNLTSPATLCGKADNRRMVLQCATGSSRLVALQKLKSNMCVCIYIYIYICNGIWGQPESFFLISYYTEVLRRVLLLSLDCSTLSLIHTFIMKSIKQGGIKYDFFSMTWLRTEPRFLGPYVCFLCFCYIFLNITEIFDL